MKKYQFIWMLMVALPAGAMNETVSEIVADTSRVVDLDEVVVVSQPKDGRLLRHQPLSSSAFTSNYLSVPTRSSILSMLTSKPLASCKALPRFSWPTTTETYGFGSLWD